jgi:hypothetical protein
MLGQAAWGWYGLAQAAAASAVLVVWIAWRAQRAGHLLRTFLAALAPFLCLLAGIWWLSQPYREAAGRYPEFTRTDTEIRYYSADLKHFLEGGAYRLQWGDLAGTAPAGEARFEGRDRIVLNPGWVALAVAVVAWFGRRRLPRRLATCGGLLCLIGGLGLLLAFGDSVGLPGSGRRIPLLLGLLQEWLSPLRAFRTVWRFSFLATVAVAWWAAAGMELLLAGNRGVRLRRLAAVVLFLLLGLESLPAPVPPVRLLAGGGPAQDDPLAGAPAGAVLTLPAPANEFSEDRTEARWLHRALSHGHPVTGGVSGWVPPWTRSLRARLVACEAGEVPAGPLLAELATAGVRYVELAELPDDPRVPRWRGLLADLGHEASRSAAGFTLYLLTLPRDGSGDSP